METMPNLLYFNANAQMNSLATVLTLFKQNQQIDGLKEKEATGMGSYVFNTGQF